MSGPSQARMLVEIIGPTLRGLLADGPDLRIVAFNGSPDEAAVEVPAGRTLVVPLRDDSTPEDAIVVLRREMDGHVSAYGVRPTTVVVPGLGRFTARDGDPVSGTFAGKVALVTGAAQGFGLAIAADLVAQGGHVILADVNGLLAEANATDLAARFGPGRATAVTMNVIDAASVADGLHATVELYGGLDLLVSNAGVLRAGSIATLPVADFDLVTTVNYRGYFLAVRFAAPILARQHAARPDYRGDIIEINSKSGLAGSSRNSAYAGSKFGGIGLTQSFALELVDQGIKVNAICPGNFFDGPLWSDPTTGLFLQYLREGKVPGAQTVDDVRAFYEAKVPMGRGCTPADVLKAIYYLVGQQYETGQALPVTGGQVMLS